MRVFIQSVILACCILPAVAAFPQILNDNTDPRAGRILAFEKMWNQAQLLRDARALEELVAPGFTNTEWDGEISSREKFLADIRDPKYKPDAMSIDNVNVRLYGDAAVVTGIYHTKGSYNGRPYDHVGRFTDTWILNDSRWQCVASHTSLVRK